MPIICSWMIFFELRVHYNDSNREAQFGSKRAYFDFEWAELDFFVVLFEL